MAALAAEALFNYTLPSDACSPIRRRCFRTIFADFVDFLNFAGSHNNVQQSVNSFRSDRVTDESVRGGKLLTPPQKLLDENQIRVYSACACS